MILNKSNKVRYINNGKQSILNIKFYKNIYNIPIYCSDDTDSMQLIILEDNSILIVINKRYVESIDKDRFKAEFWYLIARAYAKQHYNVSADICVAYWVGFNNTIKMIKGLHNCNEIEIRDRVEALENILNSNENMNIPTIDYVLQTLKFVEIE